MNSRHYTLVFFALCSVVAASFGYVLIYKQTAAQAGHSATALLDVENETKQKQHEQELIGIHEETKTEREKLSSFFIAEDSAVDFIERIEKIGTDSQTDLELSSITSDESHIRAKVGVSGTWSGVMNALMLMENMPLSIVLSDVRLDTSGDLESKDKKAPKGHMWHLSLSIEALTKKTPKE